jgi:cell division protein FtsB
VTLRFRAPSPKTARNLVIALVFLALAAVFLPIGSWIASDDNLAQQREELESVRAKNAELERQIAAAQTPEAIETAAREGFGLVFPNEETYGVPVPGPPVINLPEVWPFGLVEQPLRDYVAAR